MGYGGSGGGGLGGQRDLAFLGEFYKNSRPHTHTHGFVYQKVNQICFRKLQHNLWNHLYLLPVSLFMFIHGVGWCEVSYAVCVQWLHEMLALFAQHCMRNNRNNIVCWVFSDQTRRKGKWCGAKASSASRRVCPVPMHMCAIVCPLLTKPSEHPSTNHNQPHFLVHQNIPPFFPFIYFKPILHTHLIRCGDTNIIISSILQCHYHTFPFPCTSLFTGICPSVLRHRPSG